MVKISEMKKYLPQLFLGTGLLLLSTALFGLHYAIYRDSRDLFFYLLHGIAFLPVEVLLVTLVLHRLLNYREKQQLLNKLNMVIGAFFSEAGTNLLKQFSEFDPEINTIRKNLIIGKDWADAEFEAVAKKLKGYDYAVDIKKGSLASLREFLIIKRQFFLGLLENQNLLEHESFTSLLWAIFHLTEELNNRNSVLNLPENDLKHLSGDITRAYRLLVIQWLYYMEHLKDEYPYLFSLAMRTNPFDPDSSVKIS